MAKKSPFGKDSEPLAGFLYCFDNSHLYFILPYPYSQHIFWGKRPINAASALQNEMPQIKTTGQSAII
jgi:hypothetical protein